MNLKALFGGVALILFIGIAGFLYRSIKEQPQGPIACTMDAKICPDGTGLGRTGPSCTFPACAPPNIEISDAKIAFAIPPGYVPDDGRFSGGPEVAAAYVKPDTTSPTEIILIRRYPLQPEKSTAEFIRENAILDPSGMPASPTAFTSITLNARRFSTVLIGRFEGTVDTAYYLSREGEVLRFDAISLSVADWTDPAIDIALLTANQDLQKLLGTLQGQ